VPSGSGDEDSMAFATNRWLPCRNRSSASDAVIIVFASLTAQRYTPSIRVTSLKLLSRVR